MSDRCLNNNILRGIGGFVSTRRKDLGIFGQNTFPERRIASVTSWAVEANTSVITWVDSGTEHAQRWALPSSSQLSGSIGFVLCQDPDPWLRDRIRESHEYELRLYAHSRLRLKILNAIITRVSFLCDIETGEVIRGFADFVSSGLYYDLFELIGVFEDPAGDLEIAPTEPT